MKERSGYLSRLENFIFVLVIFISNSFSVLAQNGPAAIGARSWGIANATVSESDVNAIFNNVAGLGGNRENAILTSYDSHFGFSGLNTMSFAGVLPLSNDLTSGFSVQRFGDKLYNELAMGVGAGHQIGRFSIGLKINYLQTSVTAPSLFFSSKALVAEFGGIARFSSNLSFGAHLYNLTQSSYSGIYGSKVPTVLRAGMLYLPVKKLQWGAEINKNTDLPLSFKTGLQYEIAEKVWLRTGIATRPLTNHFGAGFVAAKFCFDYAVHTHSQLGWSHHLSLAYCFWKKEKK